MIGVCIQNDSQLCYNISVVVLFRLYLAAMHFIENAERAQRKTAKGKLMYILVFPKAKREGYTVKPMKTEPTMCTFKKYNFYYKQQIKMCNGKGAKK